MLKIRTTILSVVLVVSLVFGPASVLAAPGINFTGSPTVSQNSAGPISCDTPHALGVDGGALSLLNARDDTNSSAETVKGETPQALGVEGGFMSLLNARDESGTNPVAAILNSHTYSLRMIHNQQDAYLVYVPTGCA